MNVIFIGNNDSYEEALDYLQRAINIDQTDVTLYFKFAYFAAKFKKFHLARSALEESLYNQQHNAEEPLLKHDASGGNYIHSLNHSLTYTTLFEV